MQGIKNENDFPDFIKSSVTTHFYRMPNQPRIHDLIEVNSREITRTQNLKYNKNTNAATECSLYFLQFLYFL